MYAFTALMLLAWHHSTSDTASGLSSIILWFKYNAQGPSTGHKS